MFIETQNACLLPSSRSCVCGDGPPAVCVHALRHGVAEGLLEAAAERSSAMDGERAHRAGAGRQRVNSLQLIQPVVEFSICPS